MNQDICKDAFRQVHVPWENPIRPLSHGTRAKCHRCKAPVWYDMTVTKMAGGGLGLWRSHTVQEWP